VHLDGVGASTLGHRGAAGHGRHQVLDLLGGERLADQAREPVGLHGAGSLGSDVGGERQLHATQTRSQLDDELGAVVVDTSCQEPQLVQGTFRAQNVARLLFVGRGDLVRASDDHAEAALGALLVVADGTMMGPNSTVGRASEAIGGGGG